MLVLIIGAGLGGLCLAQGLRKAGIDYHVYEKQNNASENQSGYGIHIDAHGRHALQQCLSTELWDRFESVSTPAGTQMFFRDSNLQLLAERDDAKLLNMTVGDVERRGIGRRDLRDILLQGLDQDGINRVKWGMCFSKFEQLPDGRIRVHFADGSTIVGDVLVAADGPNSAVRKQYLPHIERVDLGIHTLAGRYPLSDELEALLPQDLINGSLNNIVPSGKGWMFVSSWALPSSSNDQSDEEIRPHIVWAYVVPADDDSVALESSTPAELKSLALKGIETWSFALKRLVANSETSAISCIPLRSMPFLTDWPSSNVTLLGDAIHNMTPMAGVGANTALRDAETLSGVLAQAASKELQVSEAICQYENSMRVYANEAIALSKRNAVNASSGQGVQRWVFRTLLKAAQASPLIMRGTIGKAVVKGHKLNVA